MTKQDSVAPDKSAQRSESGAQRGGAQGCAPRHVRRRPEPDQTRRHGRSHACAYQDHRFGTGREVQSASDHRSRDLRGHQDGLQNPGCRHSRIPEGLGQRRTQAPARQPEQERRLLRSDPRRRPEDDRRDRARVRGRNPASRSARRRRRSAGTRRSLQARSRARHHADQCSRGTRRSSCRSRRGHQFSCCRGTCARRHGACTSDPRTQRRCGRTDAVGHRRAAEDLPSGLHRRAGPRRSSGGQRTTRTVRSVCPADQGSSLPQRLQGSTASRAWCPPRLRPNSS